MIKAGIIGAAGYTGGELLRLLIFHEGVNILFAQSNSQAGKYIYEIHTDLLGETNLKFTKEIHPEIDVLFLCMGHGEAISFLKSNFLTSNLKIIDLSQDFRWKEDFIYGLPELQRDKIRMADKIANPGCFATCIQLGLLPLASEKLLSKDIHINAITGATGAGKSYSETSHFSWRANNYSTYKAFEHQHLFEIGQSILSLQNDFNASLNFVPSRGNFTRGIFASIYMECDIKLEQAYEIYESFYKDHPFVKISTTPINLKQVINTNKCLIHLEKHKNQLLLTSIIDNLLKGASGQAVQNMNLMFGLNETQGLKLKASAF